jgi:phosphoglycerate dehydrogenase-like enzyme
MSISIWDRSRPLIETVADIEIILPSNAPLSAEILRAAKKLKLVQQPASGTDNIDRDAARALQIPVCNAPEANHIAVAEAALYFILALARRVKAAGRSFEAAKIGLPLGVEICGKTLGVVGLGLSGSLLCKQASALGMKVLSVRSSSGRKEFDELLANSDFVSIHCPLTSRTENLFDEAAFAKMKPGAVLINCARGPIISKSALVQALERGTLAGVGLDVFWEEPWNPADPLFAREEVVTLPHVAGSTREAFARIATIVAENAARIAQNQAPLYRVA